MKDNDPKSTTKREQPPQPARDGTPGWLVVLLLLVGFAYAAYHYFLAA